MGEDLFKYLFYTAILAAIVYLLTNPAVIEDYSERLYLGTISAGYQDDARRMFAIDHQVRRVQDSYEAKRLSRADARQKLLDLDGQYERLIYVLSQAKASPEQRDELIIRIRGSQSAINRWGAEHGF